MVPRPWNDPGTANRERKRMVRLLIEDITIRKGGKIQLEFPLRGGAAKTLLLPKPVSFCESHKQNPALAAENGPIARIYNYSDTARIVNEKGFENWRWLAADINCIDYVRKAYGSKSPKKHLRRSERQAA